MPTFYEILGVDAHSDRTELKRAYSVLAREYHPDLKAHLGAAERERAAASMKELNAIWAVLSDPAARARYDATIAPGPQRAGPVASPDGVDDVHAQHGANTEPRPEPEPDVQKDVAGVDVEVDRRGLWIGMSVIGVVLVVALVALVASRGSQNLPGTVSGPGNQMAAFTGNGSTAGIDWSVVGPGRCIVIGSMDGRVLAVPVDCSTEGAYRIAMVVDPGESCPESLDTFDLTNGARRLCMTNT